MADESEVQKLREEISKKTNELELLKKILVEKEKEIQSRNGGVCCPTSKHQEKNKLTNSEIARYSRQLILPEIGVKGQLKLRQSSVLIVGAGGLGCPAALYLAAAGIGCIGLVDYDAVEVSNLHRQVLHSEDRVGMSKAESAKQALKRLNSSVNYICHCTQLSSSNALEIISHYDIVLDATDNVATRYLLNDACVLSNKPLVSGSALRFEGQLVVYNHNNGPCYRCLFPTPPPPETVGNCSDNGVLGAVPGVIGTLQAIEVIKIVTEGKSTFSNKMLIYDAMDGRFMQVKLRARQPSCSVCGEKPTVRQLVDYEMFCGASATDKTASLNIIRKENRISVKGYSEVLGSAEPHVLLDVREPVELDICALPNSINIALRHVSVDEKLRELREKIEKIQQTTQQPAHVYVVCKLGNDSQKAVQTLLQKFNPTIQEDESKETLCDAAKKSKRVVFKDIIGGLTSWAKQIDNDFPLY